MRADFACQLGQNLAAVLWRHTNVVCYFMSIIDDIYIARSMHASHETLFFDYCQFTDQIIQPAQNPRSWARIGGFGPVEESTVEESTAPESNSLETMAGAGNEWRLAKLLLSEEAPRLVAEYKAKLHNPDVANDVVTHIGHELVRLAAVATVASQQGGLVLEDIRSIFVANPKLSSAVLFSMGNSAAIVPGGAAQSAEQLWDEGQASLTWTATFKSTIQVGTPLGTRSEDLMGELPLKGGA